MMLSSGAVIGRVIITFSIGMGSCWFSFCWGFWALVASYLISSLGMCQPVPRKGCGAFRCCSVSPVPQSCWG